MSSSWDNDRVEVTPLGVRGRGSESLPIDPTQIKWLTQLVRQGEGLQVEFKLRAAYPEKIVHEIVAFANTKGGTLLVGVDDNGSLTGVKYPEEESLAIMRVFSKRTWPRFRIKYYYIRLNAKRWVVVFEIPESKRKPIKYREGRDRLTYYIRHQDKSIQASREAEGILRLQATKSDVSFMYGDIENKIMKALAAKSPVTLADLCKATGVVEKQLSPRLIKLAAAHVVGWRPEESRDIFFSLSV